MFDKFCFWEMGFGLVLTLCPTNDSTGKSETLDARIVVIAVTSGLTWRRNERTWKGSFVHCADPSSSVTSLLKPKIFDRRLDDNN